mgnify:CR=1 FL=1
MRRILRWQNVLLKVSQQDTHADAADSDEMDVQRLVEIDFITFIDTLPVYELFCLFHYTV